MKLSKRLFGAHGYHILEIKAEIGFSGPVGGKSCETGFRKLISGGYEE